MLGTSGVTGEVLVCVLTQSSLTDVRPRRFRDDELGAGGQLLHRKHNKHT